MRRKQGFTLIEVMVSSFVLMIAVEILSLGISYLFRVKSKYEVLLQKGAEVEERFVTQTECIPGTVYLLNEDEVIWKDKGWLYSFDMAHGGDMDLTCILTEEIDLNCQQEEDMP